MENMCTIDYVHISYNLISVLIDTSVVCSTTSPNIFCECMLDSILILLRLNFNYSKKMLLWKNVFINDIFTDTLFISSPKITYHFGI